MTSLTYCNNGVWSTKFSSISNLWATEAKNSEEFHVCRDYVLIFCEIFNLLILEKRIVILADK